MAATSRKVTPYLFLLPAALIFSFFVLYPVIFNLILSVHKWSGFGLNWEFVGVANYYKIFGDPIFWKAFRNNFLFLAFVIIVRTVISLGLALLLDKGVRGGNFFRVVFFLPYVLCWVVVGLIWMRIYDPYVGFLNLSLRKMGLGFLTQNWLGNERIVLISLATIFNWTTFGYIVVIFLAGLQGIPLQLKEAAKIDGASSAQITSHITLPLLRPVIAIVFLLTIINSFKIFPLIITTTRGGPYYSSEVPVSYLYRLAFKYYQMGDASATAIIVILILVLLALLRNRISGKSLY